MTRVLLVDDESVITDALAPFLERSGFAVQVAGDGLAALAQLDLAAPDVVVCDVLMPGLDGRALVRRLRQRENWIPVILLTKVGESHERSAALDEGADDYLNKPFDPQELVSRIRAVVRRSARGTLPLSAAQRLVSGHLVVDRLSRRVSLAGRDLVLTPRAATLLDYLISHPGELHTRAHLLSTLWGFDFPTGTRAVDHRIAELRKALGDEVGEPRFIATVAGAGYRFDGEVKAG